MPTIQSNTRELNFPAQQVFIFLTDFGNFKDLLSEDKIENWQCTADSCSFTIVGMIALKLHISEKVPGQKVRYTSDPDAKYKFDLSINLIEAGSSGCTCGIVMTYNINPFLNSYAEKPLTGLINRMLDRLAEIDFSSKG